jgi:hypothetical protein
MYVTVGAAHVFSVFLHAKLIKEAGKKRFCAKMPAAVQKCLP